MFTHDSDCKRNAFRLCPPETAPIFFRFKGKTVSLLEISAGGASFTSVNGEVGDTEAVKLLLPGQPVPIEIVMEVLRIDEEGICNCRFVNIEESTAEAIHQYVLAMQKKYLSGQKQASINQPQK